MYKKMNHEMLVLARESKGIYQSELARLIGVSQGKLSKAEKGEQSISSEIFQKIITELNYPESFFSQSTPNNPVNPYHYRKRIVSKKVGLMIESNIKIYRRNIDSLLDSVELPEYKLNSLLPDDDSPEEIARKVRYALDNEKGPINNLTNLLENNGIVIVKTNLFNDKIDGVSTFSDKRTPMIFLNTRMPYDRQRFSLAHELGHILMHFNVLSEIDNIESEANRFAAELLMPESEIKNSLRNLKFSKLGELKRYWKVSMKSLLFRAYHLKLIDQNQYRNFQISFSKKGINKSEPIQLQEEKPFILKEILRLHREELGYSKDELAKVLSLFSDDFNERFIYNERPKLKVLRNIS